MVDGNWSTASWETLTVIPSHQLSPREATRLAVATFGALKEIIMLLALIFIAKKDGERALKKGVNGVIHVSGLPVTKTNNFTYKALLLVF